MFFINSFCSDFSTRFHLGAKLGANLGKIDGESFNQGYNLGYLAGAYVDLGFSKSIGIQPEVLFSQTNTKIDSGYKVYEPEAIIGSKKHLNYLNIPILLNINASKLLTLQLGPQFSILMNKDESLVQNGQHAYTKWRSGCCVRCTIKLGFT